MLKKHDNFVQKCHFHTKLNKFYIKTVEVTILYRQMKNDQINWTKSINFV